MWVMRKAASSPRLCAASRTAHVRRVTIGVRVFSGAVITLAFRMLGRGVHIQQMMIVTREKIEFQASPVDLVVGLLGDIRLVRRKICLLYTSRCV